MYRIKKNICTASVSVYTTPQNEPCVWGAPYGPLVVMALAILYVKLNTDSESPSSSPPPPPILPFGQATLRGLTVTSGYVKNRLSGSSEIEKERVLEMDEHATHISG